MTQTGAKEPVSTNLNSIRISDTNKNQFVSMLGSGCDQANRYKKNAIDSELFLSITPTVGLKCNTQVIVLEKEKATFEKTGTADSIRVALSMKCSDGKSVLNQTTETTCGSPRIREHYSF